MTFKALWDRARCVAGWHDWWRAKRTIGNVGEQKCKRTGCIAHRVVMLREKRAKPAAPAAS